MRWLVPEGGGIIEGGMRSGDARSGSGMTMRRSGMTGRGERKRIPRKGGFRGMVGGYNFYDIS